MQQNVVVEKLKAKIQGENTQEHINDLGTRFPLVPKLLKSLLLIDLVWISKAFLNLL